MQLQTIVTLPKTTHRIGYDDHILSLGSCFATEMAYKFQQRFIPVTINPFGVLYNPISIAQAIEEAENEHADFRLQQHNGLWHSMSRHGSFSFVDRQQTITACQQSREQLKDALNTATVIIITFGTAWVYEQDGEEVANCHKMPQTMFQRRRLTADEIVARWQPLLHRYNSKKWIFTVSPIRHLKDGLHENQLSKAILLQAVDQLVDQNDSITYFPAYEIMLDELRDYRFYADDMMHPSSVAIEYIWQRFIDVFTTEKTQTKMAQCFNLWKAEQHIILHPDSDEAKRFQDKINEKRKLLL